MDNWSKAYRGFIFAVKTPKYMARKRVGMHLHQVLLQVRSVERSREFYTGMLGFKLLYDFSLEYLAVQTTNKLQIGFHPFKKQQGRKTQPIGIEFQVESVDSWYKRLNKKGVKFIEKPRDAWGEREARFLDPDGYRLAISSPSEQRT